MAEENIGLPSGPVTSQSAGYTTEQTSEVSILITALEAAKADKLAAAQEFGDSPEYLAASRAVSDATSDYNTWVLTNQPQDPTYWDGAGNEITKAQFDQVRALEEGAGISLAGGNITPTDSDGEIDEDDPSVGYVRKTDEELKEFEEQEAKANAEGESVIEANTHAKNVAESQKSKVTEDDWRVRLHLAPEANYLYKAHDPGILAPLNATDGIIFPYTPEIAVQYNANYENYDLTHSNYRGYFYTGSQTQNILVTATFTANDVAEANYMLASMHFLRTATKMFYGQDDLNRGMPPPVVFLTGLGEYQFNNHPCAITMMNYNLPNDVDYIPCGRPAGFQPLQPAKIPKNATSEERLAAVNLAKGAKPTPQVNSATTQGFEDPYTKATYVPTKISIAFTMIPIQTRDQVSKEFSLEEYANGKLLKKGFW